MVDYNSKTVGRYLSWELKEINTSNKTFYIAYYYLGPDKMPLMLNDDDLEALKEKISNVSVFKGKIIPKQKYIHN